MKIPSFIDVINLSSQPLKMDSDSDFRFGGEDDNASTEDDNASYEEEEEATPDESVEQTRQ